MWVGAVFFRVYCFGSCKRRVRAERVDLLERLLENSAENLQDKHMALSTEIDLGRKNIFISTE